MVCNRARKQTTVNRKWIKTTVNRKFSEEGKKTSTRYHLEVYNVDKRSNGWAWLDSQVSQISVAEFASQRNDCIDRSRSISISRFYTQAGGKISAQWRIQYFPEEGPPTLQGAATCDFAKFPFQTRMHSSGMRYRSSSHPWGSPSGPPPGPCTSPGTRPPRTRHPLGPGTPHPRDRAPPPCEQNHRHL